MRQIQHTDPADKVLHIRTIGCRVNIVAGTHDPAGHPYTTVEVIPDEPDDDGNEWECGASSTVIVRPKHRAEPRAPRRADDVTADEHDNEGVNNG